ncbi:NADH-quinone oxidoreductase subunit J [Bacillus shivajii]|uniref:NADH-quinone oxidoreductase subunit J n=1 Tax=Bacillus shivajii TaxID=1983719 RepID=UPI001CFBD9E9|nr:NADH-quinone oxidoreductase subunit J [Bacillus shivajii]UCZ53012.1 NADH-quinone oxidoreductase subunit J [Bacillus shivajii]
MNVHMIFFLILAIVAIAGAVCVLGFKKISHRIVSMAFSFLAIAGLYFLLRAEFIGIVQIMVYVGAITILFIFGMMMTDHRNVSFGGNPRKVHKFLSFIAVSGLLGAMLYGIISMDLPVNEDHYIGTAESIGLELYGNYIIAFIAVGFLLTAALVGAIVIARKEAE